MQHNCEVWLVLISPSWAVLTTLFQTAPALDVRCLSNFIASDFEFDDVLGVPKRKVNMGVNSQSSASKLPVTFPMKWNYESALSRCDLTKWKAICWRSELLPYQEFLICRGSHQDLKRWVLNSMQPQSHTNNQWMVLVLLDFHVPNVSKCQDVSGWNNLDFKVAEAAKDCA